VANKPIGVGGASGTLSIFLGNGDGTFQNTLTLTTPSAPTSVGIGDINLDGRLDVVATNARDTGGDFISNVSVLLGNGDGTFRPLETLALGAQPTAVAVGHFDPNSSPDLVVTSLSSNTVSVVLNQGTTTTLTSSANPAVAGQVVTLTATVTPTF